MHARRQAGNKTGCVQQQPAPLRAEPAVRPFRQHQQPAPAQQHSSVQDAQPALPARAEQRLHYRMHCNGPSLAHLHLERCARLGLGLVHVAAATW